MKTIIRLCVVNVMVAMAITGSAMKINPDVDISITGKDNLIVQWNQIKYPVQISLKDEHGLILYSESTDVEESFWIKNFNVTNLETGNYIFEFENNRSIKMVRFDVSENGLNVDDEELLIKPTISISNKIASLNLQNISETPMDVNINSANEEIYNETLLPEPVIKRKYDLSKLPNGAYTFTLSHEGRNYLIPFKLD